MLSNCVFPTFYFSSDDSNKQLCTNSISPKQESITEKLPVRKKRDRFNGMSEEEVLKRTLPDHFAHDLDIIIVSLENLLWVLHFWMDE